MNLRLAASFLLVFGSTAALADAPARRGVEAGDIDRSVAPCTDFFDYANGTWRKQNPIPASMGRWSRRWAAGEASKERLKGLLDEIAARRDWPAGSDEQMIGDHYAACMDEARVEQLGLEPLEHWLKQIDGIRSPEDLTGVISSLHERGIDVPFGLASAPDNHAPSQVLADVYASGLGLPDRDYYRKPEPRFKEAREKYLVHVENVFRLAGQDAPAAHASAASVFEFETKLAEASLDNVALRDPQATDHRTTFAALRKLAPSFDWSGYFARAHLPQADLNVQQPEFLKEVERRLRETPLAAWRTYLKWQVLRAAAPALPAAFVRGSFDFYERHLRGAKEMKPRATRCVESTDRLLGDPLGKKYVERYFPPQAKARVLELVRNLQAAMKDTLESLTWMGPETRRNALAKLATFNPKIGYPDRWRDYSGVVIRRDAHFANVWAGRRFNVEDDRRQIGKPIDRGRWGMTPPTSDAYYNPLLNEIVFPAGILQPPAFSVDAVDAVNYGAIGVVIGHEISHGFDDQGAQYDADGRLRNWWTDEDLKRFRERGQCVVDQYESYFIEPGLHHNGQLVLGESIGDLGGARLAYLGFLKSLVGQPAAPALDGFTPEQQFFIAWGQFRGDEIRPETQRLMVQGDPHPIARYRVIGPISNMPEFARAFACQADAPMVRPAEKRCRVW